MQNYPACILIVISGNSMLNSTARTENASLRLNRLKTEGDIILNGHLKKCNVSAILRAYPGSEFVVSNTLA